MAKHDVESFPEGNLQNLSTVRASARATSSTTVVTTVATATSATSATSTATVAATATATVITNDGASATAHSRDSTSASATVAAIVAAIDAAIGAVIPTATAPTISVTCAPAVSPIVSSTFAVTTSVTTFANVTSESSPSEEHCNLNPECDESYDLGNTEIITIVEEFIHKLDTKLDHIICLRNQLTDERIKTFFDWFDKQAGNQASNRVELGTLISHSEEN